MEADYLKYLRSPHWLNLRTRFFKRSQRVIVMRKKFGRIVCEFCGSRGKYNLHHKTYERLGCERLTDLVILCDDCHNKVHTAKAPSLKSATKRVRKLIRPHI